MITQFFPSPIYGGSAGALAEAMGGDALGLARAVWRAGCLWALSVNAVLRLAVLPPSPLRGTIRITGHLPRFGSNPINGGRKKSLIHPTRQKCGKTSTRGSQ